MELKMIVNNPALFLAWVFKLANEEYKGDVNLCLLELNIQGHLPHWYIIN